MIIDDFFFVCAVRHCCARQSFCLHHHHESLRMRGMSRKSNELAHTVNQISPFFLFANEQDHIFSWAQSMHRTGSLMSAIYELRVYKMHPKFFPQYIKLSNELLHLRTAHSELCGFWLTEIGGQNEGVHIWRYDSLAHRKQVRDALGKDDAWQQQHMAPVRECWAEQQNWVIVPKNGDDQFAAGKFPFYGIRIGNDVHHATAGEATKETQVLAQFQVVAGEGPLKHVEVLGGTSLDGLLLTPDGAASTDHHRIALAAPWSEKLECRWF
jgi:hypothetical protein